jgi:hypothetical protein
MGYIMKIFSPVQSQIAVCVLVVVVAASTCVTPTMSHAENAALETSVSAARDVKVTVKMIGPVTQTTDLQIVCLLKHNPSGDQYIEAMQDFNDKLGGVLSSLRERGEFVGEPGETLLLHPPAGSITPKWCIRQVRFTFLGVYSGPCDAVRRATRRL